MTDNLLPPPPMPPAEDKPSDMPGVLEKLKDEIVMLARAMAGYETLLAVYNQSKGADTDQRKRGIPILEFTTQGPDGKPLEVRTDLRKIPEEHLANVLVPMIHVHAGEMAATIQQINALVAQLTQLIQAVLQPATAQPAQPPPPEPDEVTGEE